MLITFAYGADKFGGGDGEDTEETK